MTEQADVFRQLYHLTVKAETMEIKGRQEVIDGCATARRIFFDLTQLETGEPKHDKRSRDRN